MSAKSKSAAAVEQLARVDYTVERSIAPFAEQSAVKPLLIVRKLADQPELRALSIVFLLAGLASKKGRLTRAGARMLIAHEAATFVKSRIKERIDRTRPAMARSLKDRKPRPGSNPSKKESSFPSGHTAGAVAVAQALGREFPRLRAPALGIAVVLAGAQLPRRAHYASDLGAGAAIGFVSEWLVSRAIATVGRQGSSGSLP